MSYSDDKSDRLGRCRHAIVASLEKSQEAIATYNAELDEHNVACERIPPVSDNLITTVDHARVQNMDPFKEVSSYAQEAIEIHRETPEGMGRSRSYSEAREESQACLHRTLKHLERYFMTHARGEDEQQPSLER